MAASDHARRVAPRKNGTFFGRDVQKWPTWGTRFVDVSVDVPHNGPLPFALVSFRHGGGWCYCVERVLATRCAARPTDECVLGDGERAAFAGDARACERALLRRHAGGAAPLRRRHDAPAGPRPLPLRFVSALMHEYQGIEVEHVEGEFHAKCELAIAAGAARRRRVDPVAAMALVRGAVLDKRWGSELGGRAHVRRVCCSADLEHLCWERLEGPGDLDDLKHSGDARRLVAAPRPGRKRAFKSVWLGECDVVEGFSERAPSLAERLGGFARGGAAERFRFAVRVEEEGVARPGFASALSAISGEGLRADASLASRPASKELHFASRGAAREEGVPTSKAPLSAGFVSADFGTSDHRSERSRIFGGARARGAFTLNASPGSARRFATRSRT